MFIRPELRKGDSIEIRVRTPLFIVETLDLVAAATGLTRTDVVLLALDNYCQETLHVSTVLARAAAMQRSRNGVEAEPKRSEEEE